MKIIQRGHMGEAVSAAFGVKGGFAPQLDESIVGAYMPLDLERSPWRFPAGWAISTLSKPAVVGEWGYVGCEPAAGVAMVVREYVIDNNTGGVLYYNIGFKRPSYTFTNYGYVTCAALDSGEILVGSRAWTAQQAGGQIIALHRIQVPANATAVIPLTQPVVLVPGGAYDAFVVRSATANLEVRAGFWGDQYQLP